MKVLRNADYNPKIDYLICKQLVKTLPADYDEDRIRKVYVDNSQALAIHENDLLSIKKFFEQNDILQVTNRMVEDLYKICSHEDVFLNGDTTMVLQQNLLAIAEYVNGINCQRKVLFQILFLVAYCTQHCLPIIPYSYLCDRLFYAIIAQEHDEEKALFNELTSHTKKYMRRHSLCDGETCIQSLYANKDEFLSSTDALKVGYYGSYARGSANEYSDFDILVVFSDEKSLSLSKRKSIAFWHSRMPIEIDVAVINQSNIDALPIGIRRSVKFI